MIDHDYALRATPSVTAKTRHLAVPVHVTDRIVTIQRTEAEAEHFWHQIGGAVRTILQLWQARSDARTTRKQVLDASYQSLNEHVAE